MTEYKAIETVSQAFKEYRGLDRSLIIEVEESAGDIIQACDLVAYVLDGFLKAPTEIQGAILISGINTVPVEGFDESLYKEASLKFASRYTMAQLESIHPPTDDAQASEDKE